MNSISSFQPTCFLPFASHLRVSKDATGSIPKKCSNCLSDELPSVEEWVLFWYLTGYEILLSFLYTYLLNRKDYSNCHPLNTLQKQDYFQCIGMESNISLADAIGVILESEMFNETFSHSQELSFLKKCSFFDELKLSAVLLEKNQKNMLCKWPSWLYHTANQFAIKANASNDKISEIIPNEFHRNSHSESVNNKIVNQNDASIRYPKDLLLDSLRKFPFSLPKDEKSTDKSSLNGFNPRNCMELGSFCGDKSEFHHYIRLYCAELMLGVSNPCLFNDDGNSENQAECETPFQNQLNSLLLVLRHGVQEIESMHPLSHHNSLLKSIKKFFSPISIADGSCCSPVWEQLSCWIPGISFRNSSNLTNDVIDTARIYIYSRLYTSLVAGLWHLDLSLLQVKLFKWLEFTSLVKKPTRDMITTTICSVLQTIIDASLVPVFRFMEIRHDNLSPPKIGTEWIWGYSRNFISPVDPLINAEDGAMLLVRLLRRLMEKAETAKIPEDRNIVSSKSPTSLSSETQGLIIHLLYNVLGRFFNSGFWYCLSEVEFHTSAPIVCGWIINQDFKSNSNGLDEKSDPIKSCSDLNSFLPIPWHMFLRIRDAFVFDFFPLFLSQFSWEWPWSSMLRGARQNVRKESVFNDVADLKSAQKCCKPDFFFLDLISSCMKRSYRDRLRQIFPQSLWSLWKENYDQSTSQLSTHNNHIKPIWELPPYYHQVGSHLVNLWRETESSGYSSNSVYSQSKKGDQVITSSFEFLSESWWRILRHHTGTIPEILRLRVSKDISSHAKKIIEVRYQLEVSWAAIMVIATSSYKDIFISPSIWKRTVQYLYKLVLEPLLFEAITPVSLEEKKVASSLGLHVFTSLEKTLEGLYEKHKKSHIDTKTLWKNISSSKSLINEIFGTCYSPLAQLAEEWSLLCYLDDSNEFFSDSNIDWKVLSHASDWLSTLEGLILLVESTSSSDVSCGSFLRPIDLLMAICQMSLAIDKNQNLVSGFDFDTLAPFRLVLRKIGRRMYQLSNIASKNRILGVMIHNWHKAWSWLLELERIKNLSMNNGHLIQESLGVIPWGGKLFYMELEATNNLLV